MPSKQSIRKAICERMISVMYHVKVVDHKIVNDRDFAKLVGTTNNCLSLWKKGIGCPTEYSMYVISQKYDISLTWLITGKGEMKQDPILHERLDKMEMKLNELLNK